MALKSMTGFARTAVECDGFACTIEVKSVNGKSLDVRCRVPNFIDGFDLEIKKIATRILNRGTVFINIHLEHDEAQEQYTINEERLDMLMALSEKYRGSAAVETPRLDGLLAARGVIELIRKDLDPQAIDTIKKGLSGGVETALATLNTMRAEEGARMAAVLKDQMDMIEGLVLDSEKVAEKRSQAMKDSFKENVAKLLEDTVLIDENRLEQELAVLIVKADVQEEIDRLKSHIEDARALLESDEPVGRRFDFLLQEFNREANTLCSKASHIELSRLGMALKVQIDQFREQIQNIE